MKVLVAADLHVDEIRGNFSTVHGVNSNWIESFARLEDVVDTAIEREVDIVVLAGDIFSTGHPIPEAVFRFLTIIRKLHLHNIDTYVLPGNHEYHHVTGGHVDPLEAFLSEEPGVHVTVGSTVVEHDGVSLAMLPWHRVMGKDSVDDVSKVANDTIRKLADETRDGPSLLFGHVLTSDVGFDMSKRSAETVLSASAREPVIDPSLFDIGPWDIIRLGHVHKRQVVGQTGKAMYVGSTYRVTAKEAEEQKGCEIITISDNGIVTNEYIPFNGRIIKNIIIDEDYSLDDFDEISDNFYDGDIVSFHISDSADIKIKSKINNFAEKEPGVIIRKKSNDTITVSGANNQIKIDKDDGPVVALKNYLSASMSDDDVNDHIDLFSKVVG